MALRMRENAEELHACRTRLSRLIDELEGDGLELDEIRPVVNGIREQLDEFEERVKREMRRVA